MCKLKFLYERSKLNSSIEFTSNSMEMRIEDDEMCLNNRKQLEKWYSFGKSEIGFQNGIQRDVMCSFRKSTFSSQEDPKAQYQN